VSAISDNGGYSFPHVGVHPTDALGARRYEEGARTLRAIVVEGQHSS